MIQLVQAEYNIKSGYPIVRRTLEDKKKLIEKPGFGPESCCATIEYQLRGSTRYAFGNSQMKMEMPPDIYTHNWVKLHAEMAALVAAIRRIERFDADKEQVPITNVYIELRPCEANCMQALQNILSDGTTVYYSFLHPNEVEEWKRSAHELCGV
ncbi:hypothetical protein JY446_18535 [Serratia marcescens]|uniref:Uncharacterized protein n=1 Tax=Serratia sarumanii TaxID=3020826 RepID=A0ABW8QKH7_9GAMM|nr:MULTISPECIES: hypothetical protein [Serratia]ASL96545.1 hypothetical protein BVG96_02505 [Serratia marcescens]AVN32541.1 hypothetical protein AM470_03840 [Serratia marcescens]AWC69751.1 hypothetical protein AM368_05670 [Serratia marcescens]AWC87701.1 hypothetical protein AM370_01410 [Serratia marcescens]AWS60101.1 hypothetical protein AM369_18235 [Serratia marcescens]